jgi:hypothetical protein
MACDLAHHGGACSGNFKRSRLQIALEQPAWPRIWIVKRNSVFVDQIS